MPRYVNAVPKYRKHRASGQAVVTILGHDHYLGPHGTKVSRDAYDRLIAEFLAAGRRAAKPGDTAVPELTVVELLADYWRFCKGYYRKDGKQTSEVEAMKLIIRDVKVEFARLPVSMFGPNALKRVRQMWIDRGLTRSGINKNQRRLTRIFRWAVAEELALPAIIQSLSAVPGLRKDRSEAPEAPPVLPVKTDVVERTLPFLHPTVGDMVRFQLLTGARPGEVCKMRPCYIDRSAEVWEYRVEGHKTEHHGRSRTVYIGPLAQEVIAPYLLRPANTHCFSPLEVVASSRDDRTARRVTPLSCGNRPGKRAGIAELKGGKPRSPGQAYTPGSYRRAIHNACDKAFPSPDKLEGEALKLWQSSQRWSPNQLRHTAGTEIRRRFGLEAAQVILGHAAADVTQVYAERDADKAREVARQIG